MREPIEALRAMPYAEYLTSYHWQLVRRIVIDVAAGVCAHCGEPGGWSLQVHHWTYERLGQEHVEDVSPICSACHAAAHNQPPRLGPRYQAIREEIVTGVPYADIMRPRYLRTSDERQEQPLVRDIPIADQATRRDHVAAEKAWRKLADNGGKPEMQRPVIRRHDQTGDPE